MKGGKNIKKIIRYFILIFLLVVLSYTVYSKYILKEKVVKLWKYSGLVVLSESMEPEIEKCELIIIKECKEYELNDIITYLDEENNLITHRIVQIDEYGFIAKGDNNDISDENTELENIEGKVIYHSKILGFFVLYCLKYIIIMCFVIFVIYCVYDALHKEEKYEKKEK